MLRFALFGIPVGIDWFFWITAFLIGGGLSAQDPRSSLVVVVHMAVILISILVHELGHAVAGRRFGAYPAIRLHGLGGLTYLPGAQFNRVQGILVSGAGPMAGLLLGLAALIAALLLPFESIWWRAGIGFALYVNFFWTFLNLLPIQPLDGGQILRDFLGPNRLRVTCWIGMIFAVGLAVLAFQSGLYILMILLGFLAYHNYQSQPIIGGGVVTQPSGDR